MRAGHTVFVPFLADFGGCRSRAAISGRSDRIDRACNADSPVPWGEPGLSRFRHGGGVTVVVPSTGFFRPGPMGSDSQTKLSVPFLDPESWVFPVKSLFRLHFEYARRLIELSHAAGRDAPWVVDEVDCRDVLLTPAAELTPAMKPVRALLDACRDDPARFQEEVLGRTLWSKQVEVCQAIARSPVTVVPAGRAVGKSFLLAGTVLWWLYTRPNSLVITTGPDHRQVVSVLWKEIRRAFGPGSMRRAGTARG